MQVNTVLPAALAVLAAAFISGSQESANRTETEFFRITKESEPEPERPAGIDASAWVPIGQRCGLIVRRTTQQEDPFLEGQLTCQIDGSWQPVHLAHRPPAVIPSD